MKETKEAAEQLDEKEETTAQGTSEETTAEQEPEKELTPEEKLQAEIDALKAENGELNNKFLRLYSDFENFRKRTAKERIELLDTAGKDVIKAILPVIDDFERAMKTMDDASDVKSVKEGVDLIYNKLQNSMKQQGLKPMVSIDEKFDSEIHDAITKIPAPNKKKIGVVMDEIEKGYYLGETVIRHAKVVVGS